MSVELELIGRVAEMLDSAGWAIEVDRAKDGLQLDIYAAKDSSPALVIECKAYRKLLGLRTAREFASVVGFLRESTPELQAWLVTTNGFTPNAARALQEHQIRGFTISELAQQFGPKKNRVSKDRSTWAADADIARKKKQRVFVIMPFDEQMLDVFILGIR